MKNKNYSNCGPTHFKQKKMKPTISSSSSQKKRVKKMSVKKNALYHVTF